MSQLHEVKGAELPQFIASGEVVVVEFGADWCQPCRLMEPVLKGLAVELSGKVAIAKVDIDEDQAVAQKYQVMSLPTLIVFKNGEPVQRASGGKSKSELLALLDAA